MRAKYKSIMINEYALEDETDFSFIGRTLRKIFNVLIENGAPLNADEINEYHYENTNNNDEPTGIRYTISAPFIDSKEAELQDGDEIRTINVKTFAISIYLSYSSMRYNLYMEVSENNYDILQYGGYQYYSPRYCEFDLSYCEQIMTGPFSHYHINLVRDEESLFFGIISGDKFYDNLCSGINMGFTPIKSLSNKSVSEFGFFQFNQQTYRYSDNAERFAWGPMVYLLQPTDEQLIVSYNIYEKFGGSISSCGSKIDCDETGKIVLEPLMTGFKDYYYDKVYTSNVIRSQDLTEEVVITDKGVFLKGGHPLFLGQEDRQWQGSMVFDVTNSYNQEEN